jgi:hypothetical protein
MTRLALLPRRPAWALLAALLLLVAHGLGASPSAPAHPSRGPSHGDAALYRAIDARMQAGEGYYRATADEHRLRRYPLRPFVTVRLPTLAWITTSLGATGTLILLRLLVLATIAATVFRLRAALPSRPLWGAACALAAACIVPLAEPALAVWHEAWAGLLIALSLACRSERRWWPSVLLGLAAVLFREIALPYLFLMGALALIERRRRETIGWAVAILAFGVALAGHAAAVNKVTTFADLASPGWSSFGGWPFALTVARDCSILRALPARCAALLVPLALLGWAAWRDGYALRAALTFVAWLGAFTLIGRPDNFYWGLLMAPLLPVGLILALPALADLGRVLRPTAPSARPQVFGPA